ncbi:MAG TPA: adenylate/guanylate cyclase domain-containing protein [Chloroflexia bacterium]|nr:adenylate/guanylate cyclase domain-containing protein [Chloroflexia bacterium]
MNPEQTAILVVDDDENNRLLTARRVQRYGHQVSFAANGREALTLMRAQPFDLVLLDIMMPEMSGYEVLEQVKADATLRHLPIIMISALDDLASVVKCIELGAEDYLFKPINSVLLNARVGASLEKKRLRDQEQTYLRAVQAEQERSERLLLNILPAPVAARLKTDPRTIADSFPDATVLFADIVDFTRLAGAIPPISLVDLLNDIFSAFDLLALQYGLEKIKTMGDAYMVVGGVPIPRPDHVEAIAEMALAMQRSIVSFRTPAGPPFTIRIGISTGPVVAGVIGRQKFSYDLWGDTVNMASRMESQGVPGQIQVTEATYRRLRDKFRLKERGLILVKGKGEMRVFLLTGRRE